MKKILFLSALICLITVSAFAQLPSTRTYPPNQLLIQRLNTQSYTQLTPTYYHGNGVNAVVGKDTLVGVDTIECYWAYTAPYNSKFIVNVNPIVSTISGTIYFFCSPNNVDWYAVTGIATVCTGCVGASVTMSSLSASTRYILDAGNTNMPYWKAVVANSNAGGTGVITGVGIYAGTGN